MALYHEHQPFSGPPYAIDIIQHIALPPLGTFDAFDLARRTRTGGGQIMNTTQRSRRPHQGLYIVQQHKEANDLGTSPEQIFRIDKELDGKTIHVVGPRRLHNELLVSFIRKETGADCLLTDFDLVKGYLVDTAEEPSRLFLIDYREPRFQEMLKQASLDTSSSSLVERLISLFNSSKEKDATERKHANSTCGVLFNCNSTTTLLHCMCRLFNGAGNPENPSAESMETARETATACPLTWRELQLLMLMTEGLRNREIAGRIGISSYTVRTHLYNSFGKIGARNRLEASGWIEAHISFVFLLI
jgi:DNA-binding CsgD family transcriptional regulator